MSEGWRQKYTHCAICGCLTDCETYVINGSYDYVDDNGRPKWYCPDCIDRYVCPPDNPPGEDDDRECCGNCGEWVYPNEDDSCPECGGNVYW